MNPTPLRSKRLVPIRRIGMLTAALVMVSASIGSPALAADPDEIAPAPPAIGADVPLSYFGPSPSKVQKELVGPVQLLNSGTIDMDKGTITLPLYRGELKNGKNVWYVLTDTTDKGNADALGINYSAKLAYAATGNGARTANLGNDGVLVFDEGTVDFKPERKVTPDDAPNFFPPKTAEPGSVGSADYSPLVRIANAGGQIYNAPVIAYDVAADKLKFDAGKVDYSVVHDKVVSIAATANGGTVTLDLTTGFSFAKPILYLSLDANDPLPAAVEGVTAAPGLGDIRVGGDDGAFSGVERLFTVVNGPTGAENPQRQGLNSALSEGRSPLNVFGGIPTVATDYSPLWDFNAAEWTKEAIDKGYRSRVIEEFQILGLVEQGWLTGPGGADFGSTGFIVNCPIVFRFL
jgi:hypothetical protein